MRTGILLLAALAIPGWLLAHGGHEHVKGTVTAVDSSHVELKTPDGKSVSVKITGDTKIEVEGKMAQVKGKVQNTAGGMKDKMKEKNQEGGT